MNNVIKLIYDRKSVRKFENREISEEDEKFILNSAIMAPTAGNQQMYSILRISDEQLKEELSVKCDNQPFIKEAKLVLIFLADFKKWYDIYSLAGAEPRDVGIGDMFLAIDDALISAQNSVIGAESLGIGSCYIGDIMENCEDIRELLHLPDYVFPACMVVYGYPAESQKLRAKPERVPVEYIVKDNFYSEYTDDELYSMIGKSGEEFNDYIRKFCKRKYNSDFSKEMNRSVKEYMKIFFRE